MFADMSLNRRTATSIGTPLAGRASMMDMFCFLKNYKHSADRLQVLSQVPIYTADAGESKQCGNLHKDI